MSNWQEFLGFWGDPRELTDAAASNGQSLTEYVHEIYLGIYPDGGSADFDAAVVADEIAAEAAEQAEAEDEPNASIFVAVTGEDGTFYDQVQRHNLDEHLRILRDGGYQAQRVYASNVPPCKYRDFTISGLKSYYEHSWDGGDQFYFPAENFEEE